MRAQAAETGDIQGMQAWAGQSVRLGRAEPAGRLVRHMWDGALALLKEGHAEVWKPGQWRGAAGHSASAAAACRSRIPLAQAAGRGLLPSGVRVAEPLQ
jgi:hypothetical protein